MATRGGGGCGGALPGARVAAIGCFVGAVVCATNTYLGLQSGWVTLASVPAAVVTHLLARACARCERARRARGGADNGGGIGDGDSAPWWSAHDHVVAQTIAVAAAVIPVAAGFVGILPALELAQSAVLRSTARQLAWCVATCFLGIALGVPLRRVALVTMRLPFPSGRAAAAVVKQLHAGDGAGAASAAAAASGGGTVVAGTAAALASAAAGDGGGGRALAISAGLAACYPLLTYAVPVVAVLPVASWLHAPLLTQWYWSLTPSPAYLAQGALMGMRTCVGMAVGAIVGWGVLGPLGASSGLIPNPAVSSWPDGGRAFLTWIALAVIVTEATFTLASLAARGAVAVASAVRRELRRRRNGTTGGAMAPALGDDGEEAGDGDVSKALAIAAAPSPGAAAEGIGAPATTRNRSIEAMPLLGDSGSIAVPATAALIAVDPPVATHVPLAPLAVPTPATPSLDALAIGGGVGTLAALALCLLLGCLMFGLALGELVLALVLSVVIALACVRVLGEADINPVSGLAKLSQAAFLLVSCSPASNLLAGAIAEAVAAQSADLMMDLRTGLDLGVDPRRQVVAQVIGTCVGIVVSAAAYALLSSAVGVPSASLPAPTAAVWLAMAQLAEAGLGVIPATVWPAASGAAPQCSAASISEGGGEVVARWGGGGNNMRGGDGGCCVVPRGCVCLREQGSKSACLAFAQCPAPPQYPRSCNVHTLAVFACSPQHGTRTAQPTRHPRVTVICIGPT